MDFHESRLVSRNGATSAANGASGLALANNAEFCAFAANGNSSLDPARRQPYQVIFRHELELGVPVTVTGVMNYSGWSFVNPLPPLVLQARQGGGAFVTKSVTCDANGAFSVNLVVPATGDWELYGKSLTTLRKKQGTFSLGSGTVNIGTIDLVNGDAVDNEVVDLADYTLIAAQFNALEGDPGWQPSADLNGDKTVDLTDYTLMAGNFNAVGD